MPEEQAQRDEEPRRRNHPSAAEKVDDWLEFVGDRIEKGEVRFPFPLFESCHPDIAFLADSAKFPWGTLQDMFLDKDRDEFFRVLKGRLELQPNDINLRAAAISLYWHLSRLYLKWQYPDYDVDDVTGEWVEDRVNEATGELVPLSYWETDLSGEREHHRREFHGYLCRLVRTLKVERDCPDWHRTNWEIRNACAARDWDRAKELFRHASVRKQHREPELTVLEKCFDYRVEFGPQIDSRLGLGLPPPGDVHPYCESVRTHFLAHYPLSLDALEVPLDYFYPQSKLSKLFRHETSLSFVWGALQDDPSPRSSNARYASRHEGETTGHEFEEFGPYQDFYMSIVAQQREACGDLGGAAWVYEALASRPEPFEGLRSSILFGLRAAKLYRSIGETGKAENVLVSMLGENPENVKTLQELLKVQLDRSDLNAALPLGERLSTLTGQENWTPETRLLLALPRPAVSQDLLESEVRDYPYFLSLCSPCKNDWKYALNQELEAKASEIWRDERLREGAFVFCNVAERELRERVFVPFRTRFTESGGREQPSDQLVATDEILRSFIKDGRITLGGMVRSIRHAKQIPNSILELILRNDFPQVLARETLHKLDQLTTIRNAVHTGLDPQLAVHARALAEDIIGAINWRWRRAVHEAGHAVAALLLPNLKLVSVSLHPDISPRGVATSGSCEIKFPIEGDTSRDTCTQRITHAYCGATAEGLFFREDPYQVLDRQEDDKSAVRECVCELRSQGLSEPDVGKCREGAWEAAKSLVEEQRSRIEAVALALREKGKLTGVDVDEIVQRIDPRR